MPSDSTAPTISSVTSSTSDGSYNAGDSVAVTVNFSEAVTLSGGNLVVTLETGSTDQTVTISSISSATSASGTYTVQSGDTSSDLTVGSIALSAGSLSDAAGNAMSSFSIGTNLAASSALVIDNTAPAMPSRRQTAQAPRSRAVLQPLITQSHSPLPPARQRLTLLLLMFN